MALQSEQHGWLLQVEESFSLSMCQSESIGALVQSQFAVEEYGAVLLCARECEMLLSESLVKCNI